VKGKLAEISNNTKRTTLEIYYLHEKCYRTLFIYPGVFISMPVIIGKMSLSNKGDLILVIRPSKVSPEHI